MCDSQCAEPSLPAVTEHGTPSCWVPIPLPLSQPGGPIVCMDVRAYDSGCVGSGMRAPHEAEGSECSRGGDRALGAENRVRAAGSECSRFRVCCGFGLGQAVAVCVSVERGGEEERGGGEGGGEGGSALKLKVEWACEWQAEEERRLLGTFWCNGLSDR